MTKTAIRETKLYAHLLKMYKDPVEAFEVIECMHTSISDGQDIQDVLEDNDLSIAFIEDLTNITQF